MLLLSHTSVAVAMEGGNVTAVLVDAHATMSAAVNAVFSTHALGTGSSAGFPGDINSRVMSPKPVPSITSPGGLSMVYIDTNSLSRKSREIQRAVDMHGAARANLLYYDRDGAGYVALRGNVTIADAAEAQREWWDGWSPFYPEKENTSFYSVLRFKPDWLELSSGPAQSGRADWLPVSLQRVDGTWKVVVSPGPPSPSPPTPPAASNWKCSICQHVYDPLKDGGGVEFENLPDTFKCPICGAPKSAFKKMTLADGSHQWIHELV